MNQYFNNKNINYNTLRLTLLFMTVYTFCSAQTINSISGNVINDKNEVLLGNAILLSAKDSTVVAGTSFFSGKFELTNLNIDKGILKFTSLQFEDTYVDITYQGHSEMDLGDIIVQEQQNQLEEVAIVSKSSLVKEKEDGSLEIKVANTALATSISVGEILSRSPSIIYDENNEINVFGKGSALIFINGVRVLAERLSTLSPSSIEKIEIISNPGPRYDAEGNAVINIITKRNIDEGSKGTIKNYYSYTDFAAGGQNRTNIDYNYAKGKWSLRGNYGLLVGKERQILETTRSREEPNDIFSSDITTDWRQNYDNFSNYGVGIQYNFNKKSYMSIEYTGAYEDLGGNQLSDNIILDNGEQGIYTSDISLDEINLKNTINVNYYTKIDTLGSNLFVGSQYSSYNEDFDNDIRQLNTINGVENALLTNNVGDSKIKIASTQFDYVKVFKSKQRLEFGGKFAFVNNKSNTAFFDIDENGLRTIDEDLSNNFEYNERVPAGYMNFNGALSEKINYSTGFRVEWTDYDLFTSIDQGRVIEDSYVNIFPNASINVKFSDNKTSYLSYSSRIRRPPYHLLNPFVIFQDAFTSIQGNPNLQPAKVHSIELGGAIDKWSLKLGYNFTIDPIYGGAFQSEDNPSEYILRRENLSKEHSYFASLTKNIKLRWWRSTNIASISFNDLIDDTNVFEIRENKPFLYLYSQNSFDLKDFLTIYLSGWYLGDKQDGIYLRKNQSFINIGLEKKFLKNTLKCNLDFNDIFHKRRAAGEYRVGNTDVLFARKYNTNQIRFSVSYNFGSLKKSKYKNKDVGKPETGRVQ